MGCLEVVVGYVWGFGNIGDAAITPGLLTLLGRHIPGCEATVVSERGHEKIAKYIGRHFPECRAIADDLGAAFDRILREEGAGGLLPEGEDAAEWVLDELPRMIVDDLESRGSGLLAQMRESDLFIYNSGMILVYGPGTLAGEDFWGYTVRRSLPLLIAREIGVSYGVYSHSFDSFDDAPGRPYFRRLLNHADFVFCRDSNSLQYLQRLDIGPEAARFVPDSTLAFSGEEEGWAERFLDRHEVGERQFLVVIPRTWLGDHITRERIGPERGEEHMASLQEVIGTWVKRTAHPVVLGVEVEDELVNVRELVYERLPEEVREKCVMLEEFWRPEQAASLYRRAEAVLTVELHSFLLAVAQGTPAVVWTFAESGRKIEMVRDFGLGEWLFDIDEDDAQAVADCLLEIHESQPQMRRRLEAVDDFPGFLDVEAVVFQRGAVGDAVVEAQDATARGDHRRDLVFQLGDDGVLALAYDVLVKAAHEGQAAAVLLAEGDNIHSSRRLAGIHPVDPRVEEGIDHGGHVAVGILTEQPRAAVAEHVPDAAVIRGDELLDLLRAGE
ncbi:MAG: polysaccharide pyruvyl transferase family protein [Armatimonadota bacterium]